jgi:hypothetical protein
MKRLGLFGRTRAIEAQIDDFLDKLSQSAICFHLGVRHYLSHGTGEQFEEKRSRVNELESAADSLRRTIEAQIVSTWLICPVLAALLSATLFAGVRRLLKATHVHLLRIDAYTRMALIVTGIFGASSLGANNIANVIGVFVPASPFTDFTVFGSIPFTAVEQILLLGGIAIAAGMMTNSRHVVETVGEQLSDLTPAPSYAAKRRSVQLTVPRVPARSRRAIHR